MTRIPYYVQATPSPLYGSRALSCCVGDSTTDALLAPVTAALLPQLKDIVAKSAEASEPMIRRIVVEDVLPKFGTAVVLGMLVGAISAAAVGSWFATRRR